MFAFFCFPFVLLFICIEARLPVNERLSVPQHARPLIVLDAGHGGDNAGAKVGLLQEKKIALQTTLCVKNFLMDWGYRVILTRSRDVFIPLHRRVSIANKTHAKIFVSIHYNSSQSSDAQGLEVFYYGGRESSRMDCSKKLASEILTQMQKATGALSRGVKAGNFHVIRETTMPAVLVEGGFMTHSEERSLLKNKQYIEKLALGIARGVDFYISKNKQ